VCGVRNETVTETMNVWFRAKSLPVQTQFKKKQDFAGSYTSSHKNKLMTRNQQLGHEYPFLFPACQRELMMCVCPSPPSCFLLLLGPWIFLSLAAILPSSSRASWISIPCPTESWQLQPTINDFVNMTGSPASTALDCNDHSQYTAQIHLLPCHAC